MKKIFVAAAVAALSLGLGVSAASADVAPDGDTYFQCQEVGLGEIDEFGNFVPNPEWQECWDQLFKSTGTVVYGGSTGSYVEPAPTATKGKR